VWSGPWVGIGDVHAGRAARWSDQHHDVLRALNSPARQHRFLEGQTHE
jgi:hypothetical protein